MYDLHAKRNLHTIQTKEFFMNTPPDSKKHPDSESEAHQALKSNLSENEQKALELKEHSEHETGQKRENLQNEAANKAE